MDTPRAGKVKLPGHWTRKAKVIEQVPQRWADTGLTVEPDLPHVSGRVFVRVDGNGAWVRLPGTASILPRTVRSAWDGRGYAVTLADFPDAIVTPCMLDDIHLPAGPGAPRPHPNPASTRTPHGETPMLTMPTATEIRHAMFLGCVLGTLVTVALCTWLT